ncbi:MAG: tRNA modification GTPase [Campylobacterota bacterium]|nr:tRNA modification GTPase [Campylobacterota bacterium]
MKNQFFQTDTIVALATSRGRGAISIVRVSGSDALAIASKLTKKSTFTPRHATLSQLFDRNNEIIDEALVLYFNAPKSFTGEDIVEFQLHGGDAVAMVAIDEILNLGARVAHPGEFTKRAFLNNKLDLTKAEAIAKLIDAKSKESAKLLARQLKGELKKFVDAQRDELVRILANSEVMIDYADEDLPDELLKNLEDSLKKLSNELLKTKQLSENRDGFFSGYKVAIVGKPNVGKSSLLNSLLAYERAIVSEIEGTTRDTIEEYIVLGEHTIKIVDTAGIRESEDRIEKIGIEYSKRMIEDSDIIIALFDNSREFDKNDEEILSIIKKEKSQKPLIVVMNKTDLENRFNEALLEEEVVKISCKESVLALKNALLKILDKMHEGSEQILISKRQIDIVSRTIESINNSFAPLRRGELEIFSFYINEAIGNISSISRPYEHSQMLDEMFSNFCLGK